MIRTEIASALALGIALAASAPAALAQPAPVGGTMWNESEAGWQGTWTRLGRTKDWNAVWTKGGKVVRANLVITIRGNDVQIDRRDFEGSGAGRGCTYNGKISGRIVSGTYGCDWAPNPMKWSATIVQ